MDQEVGGSSPPSCTNQALAKASAQTPQPPHSPRGNRGSPIRHPVEQDQFAFEDTPKLIFVKAVDSAQVRIRIEFLELCLLDSDRANAPNLMTC